MELPAAIAAQLAASGEAQFVAPAGLPAAWLAEGFDWKMDATLSSAEIEKAEGVVTAAFCGVADSGTIVLHHSASGRAAGDYSAARLASLRDLREPGGGDVAGVFQPVPDRRRHWPHISRAERDGRH